MLFHINFIPGLIAMTHYGTYSLPLSKSLIFKTNTVCAQSRCSLLLKKDVVAWQWKKNHTVGQVPKSNW